MNLTIDDAEILCDIVLDVGQSHGLIKDDFMRRFEFRQCRPKTRDGAYGGVTWSAGRRIPFIRVSHNSREFSFEQYRTYLQEFNRTPSRGVWRRAVEAMICGEWMFVEYAKISKDPEIGAFISHDPYRHVLAILSHEVAHAIAHWYKPPAYENHNTGWQEIYRTLRVNTFKQL